MTKEAFDNVGIRRYPVHPLPPSKLPVWLNYTVAAVVIRDEFQRPTITTHNVKTNENRKLNKMAAISAFGLMAATL